MLSNEHSGPAGHFLPKKTHPVGESESERGSVVSYVLEPFADEPQTIDVERQEGLVPRSCVCVCVIVSIIHNNVDDSIAMLIVSSFLMPIRYHSVAAATAATILCCQRGWAMTAAYRTNPHNVAQ